MKKIFLFLLLIPIFSVSCDMWDDGGYPRKVYFPKEGGEKSYTGELGIGWFEISSGNRDEHADSERQEDGTRYAELDWLTVTSPSRSSRVINFTVKPNSEPSERELNVYINRGAPPCVHIVIIQD